MEKLLLHVCCGPCALGSVPAFRADGFEPAGYYFNPNIHPWHEYEKRWETLKQVSGMLGMELLPPGEYNYKEHLLTALQGENRCEACYRLRLMGAAQKAAESHINAFSTTLFISPYQDKEKLAKAGREAGEKYGVRFVLKDLRPYFRQAQEEARRNNLYRQGYCGCIFSEVERYGKKGLKAGEQCW